MSEWQPIETAPKDGFTKIIAAAWNRDLSASVILIGHLEGPNSDQGDRTKPRIINGMSIFYPTHWTPLPMISGNLAELNHILKLEVDHSEPQQ